MMRELPEIHLRAIEPEDLDILYTIENDVALWNVGTTNVPYSRYMLHDYIAHANADIYQDRQVRLIIENLEGEVVGITDVVNFDPQHLRAELGIVIMAPSRRQGYATAAIQEMKRYAATVLHLHQLYVIVDEHNTAARNLFGNLAFKETARLEHWLYNGHQYHDALLLQVFL